MKIAYNPLSSPALSAAPAGSDITFDLPGINIYARGIRFKGTDTTYNVFKKHTSSGSGGYNGLVPVPSYTTNSTRYLREDGTWQVPTPQIISSIYTLLSNEDLNTLKEEGRWYFIVGGSTTTNGPSGANNGAELYVGRNASGYRYQKVITTTGIIWFRYWNSTVWQPWVRWYTDANTDKNVVQSVSTTSDFRPLIIGYISSTNPASLTTTATNLVYTANALYALPSTASLFARTFVGALKGNADTSTSLGNINVGNAALPVYFAAGKPVACVAGSLFSVLTNDTNQISITVAGQNRKLTVNYASVAERANTLHCFDIRNSIPLPNDKLSYAVTSWFNLAGTPDTGWWGGLTVKGWGENYEAWEIAGPATSINSLRGFFLRSGWASTWNSWERILTSANTSLTTTTTNITIKINNVTATLPTEGSNDGRYVRKIGDIMTGELKSTSVNAYRMAHGNYGIIFRNDGDSFYMLLTNSGSALSGSYNSLRPFAITLGTGLVRIGHGLTVSGTIVGNNTIQGTRLISTATSGTAPLIVASNTLVSNLNSDLLDNYNLADILPNSIYHATLGSLVTTDITSGSDAMVTVNISGNSYGDRVINTVLLFYNYNSGGYIGSVAATHFGYNFGSILVFNYNGKICFWFKLSRAYLSYIITVRSTISGVLYNRIATISNVAMPTTGVTRLISVTPFQGAYLDSNVASATKLQTARAINGTLFDGTAAITTARWGYARTLTLTGSITGSVVIDGGGNVSLATTYLAGNIGNLDARYVNVTGDTMTGSLTAPRFLSNIATGTSPFVVNSSTVVANLNSDMLDGLHSGNFARSFGEWSPGTNTTLTMDEYIAKMHNNLNFTALGASSWRHGWWYAGTDQISTSIGTLDLAGAAVYSNSFSGYSTSDYKTMIFHLNDGETYKYTSEESAVKSWVRYWTTRNLNPGNYVTALGTSGEFLTWTRNGTVNNILVPKAYKSDLLEAYTASNFTSGGHYLRAVRSTSGWTTRLYMGYYRDTTLLNTVLVAYADNSHTSAYVTSGFSAVKVISWDCNAPDRVVYSDYGNAGRVVANAPVGWQYGTLLHLGHSNFLGVLGNLNILLMWDVAHNTTNGGTLWFRGKDSERGWAKNWCKVITDLNYTSILDGRYVNITGDTMTGLLAINTSGVYVKFGCQNGGHAHYETSASISHWFNKTIDVNGIIRVYNTGTYMSATGFYRNGSSDAYVLLGGGGHLVYSAGLGASTLVLRTPNGYILASYFYSAIGDESPSIGSVFIRNTTDNYIRRTSYSNFISNIGNSLDSRYVNKTGDTMVGRLAIQINSVSSLTLSLLNSNEGWTYLTMGNGTSGAKAVHIAWSTLSHSSIPANAFHIRPGGENSIAGFTSDKVYLALRLVIDTTGRCYPISTGTRRAGMYGVYDATKIGHIWSMGTGYIISEDGANFGNLYGLAYKHTNNPTGGIMAGGHQAVWCLNGTPKAALGENGVWAAGGFHKAGHNSTHLLRADGGAAAFNWAGLGGLPTWLWGGNAPHDYYVYNPSNFNVSTAIYSWGLQAKYIANLNTPTWINEQVTINTYDMNASNMPPSGGNNANGVINFSYGTHGSSGHYGFLFSNRSGNELFYRGWSAGTPGAWQLAATRAFTTATYATKDSINKQVGGTRNAQMIWDSWGTDTYGGAILIREHNYVTTGQSAWGYSPALNFHWGGRTTVRFGLRSDGQIAVDNVPLSLNTHNHNSNYVTSLGTSGNSLTWVKNGATNYITVPYATNADMVDGVHAASLFRNFGAYNTGLVAIELSGSSSWATTTGGYLETYGNSLHVRGVNTWNFRLDFGTSNGIYLYSGINTTTMAYRGRLAFVSDIPNPANYYWANVRISAASNGGTSPTFSTAYVSNWFRSTGATGWYSETYGGGIHMFDTVWVRTYGGKNFFCDSIILAGNRFYTGYDSGVTNSMSCSNWFRSNGTTGWVNASYGGGIYQTDTTYVRVYGSKIFYANSGYLAPYTAGSWISMASRTNCIFPTEANTPSSAHALYRLTYNNGNRIVFGGLGNEIGFYGFSAANVSNGTNTVSWSAKWYSDGSFHSSNTIASAGFKHNSVNSDAYVLLAGGGYKVITDFAKGNAGSSTLGVYVTAGTVTAMTYSLKANVNAGLGGLLAMYRDSTTLTFCNSSVGDDNIPIYIKDGVLKSCNPMLINRSAIAYCTSNGINVSFYADIRKIAGNFNLVLLSAAIPPAFFRNLGLWTFVGELPPSCSPARTHTVVLYADNNGSDNDACMLRISNNGDIAIYGSNLNLIGAHYFNTVYFSVNTY